MTFLRTINSFLVGRALRYLAGRDQVDALHSSVKRDQVGQHLLYERWRQRARDGSAPFELRDAGLSVFSQSDEDGVLLAIFACIGFGSRRLVDLGCGTPENSNSANLLCNWGFCGLLVDGAADQTNISSAFYAVSRDTSLYPPVVRRAWITSESVNQLIAGAGLGGEIDLLSIDLDGIDWWVWRAIEIVQPRVLVVEVQTIWGPEESVTVPYRPDFRREDGYNYCGASLAAWVKLCRERGYRLVGGNRYGQNAFFVRNGLADDVLPEVNPASCLTHPLAVDGQWTRLPRVRDWAWERV